MLFDSIVYGPIHSRRLGVSLGVNLMPTDRKICTFDCIYCECGFNGDMTHPTFPSREEVSQALTNQLSTMPQPPDVITFSGNGEPTVHPDFESIIADTCALRDRYCPSAKVCVLSNSTQLERESVRRALMQCDNRILKLDSAIDTTMHLIDQPVNPRLSVQQIEEWLAFFDGKFTLQTCFLRGEYRGHVIDNTTTEEVQAWYDMVHRLHPQQVMIYVIDRATPVSSLVKIDRPTMEQIAAPLRAEGLDIIVCA